MDINQLPKRYQHLFKENSPTGRCLIKKWILKFKLLPYQCRNCKNEGEWQGKPLSLELEHKNGIRNDNRPQNLELLCPNCHSQSPQKKRRTKVTKEEILLTSSSAHSIREILLKLELADSVSNYERVREVLVENKQELPNRNLKIPTKKARPSKIEWPPKKELQKWVNKNPITKIAKKLGVSDVAVRKWCKKLGITTQPRGFWAKETKRRRETKTLAGKANNKRS